MTVKKRADPSTIPTDLTLHTNVKTSIELMLALEEEISQVKNGDLPIDKGRVVNQYRRNQMRLIELSIQAARMDQQLKSMMRTYFDPKKTVEGKKK